MSARKSQTELSESLLGHQLPLSVAAHLARTQLIPDPLPAYEGQHISEMLDVVADALARVAPLYVQDAKAGASRQLQESELEGARVRRGATLLVLKDGRSLSAVSIKRADLRQGIAILKAVGIQECTRNGKHRPAAQASGPDALDELRRRLAEVEQLLRPPLAPAQLERANALMVAIARSAPAGQISNLAMRLMSAVHESRSGAAPDADAIGVALGRLRAALGGPEGPRN